MEDKTRMRERQKQQLDTFIEQTGLTLTALADEAGIAPSTLTRFYNSTEHKHILSATTFMKIAAAVARRATRTVAHSSFDEGEDARRETVDSLSETETVLQQVVKNLEGRDISGYKRLLHEPYGDAQSHIPVLGGAVGGNDGEFLMNGQINEYVLAPPALSRVVGAYALYMWGDSMTPKYEEGQLLYVHPTRPPRSKDYVVVQLHNGTALIKRFVSASAETLKLEQFNPAMVIEIPRDLVKATHTIMLADERI